MKQAHQDRVDLRNSVGSRWRAALKALAKPAQRVHNYRNLHRLMFYDAMCQLDHCKDDK